MRNTIIIKHKTLTSISVKTIPFNIRKTSKENKYNVKLF